MNNALSPNEPRRNQSCCPIIELRQYTLHPGSRDVLIELFEREFVESQEAVGITVIGQFRDLDDPDRFVWLRGFRDMRTRPEALGAFYGGPVWGAHRDAANVTMIDSDNVLLLQPARPGSGLSLGGSERPPPGSRRIANGLLTATIYALDVPVDKFIDFFEHELHPLFMNAGASILSSFVTENSVNNFPALPVREGEQVFVWFSLFEDQNVYERYLAELARSQEARNKKFNALAGQLKGLPQILRLTPTARSLLHG